MYTGELGRYNPTTTSDIEFHNQRRRDGLEGEAAAEAKLAEHFQKLERHVQIKMQGPDGRWTTLVYATPEVQSGLDGEASGDSMPEETIPQAPTGE